MSLLCAALPSTEKEAAASSSLMEMGQEMEEATLEVPEGRLQIRICLGGLPGSG